MNKSSTFDAKNNLSALIAAAIRGEPQVITNNGPGYYRLVPLGTQKV